MKKPTKTTHRDAFLETMKEVSLEIATDKAASRRDRNTAVANGAKLLQIEHRIAPGDEGDFFG
jgi:hypothetical protein